MAKRKAARRSAAGKRGRKSASRRTAKQRLAAKRRATAKRRPAAKRRATAKRRPAARRASTRSTRRVRAAAAPRRAPNLNRDRRRLTGDDVVPTPPSSLNLDRRGSAARTGRAEMLDRMRKHGAMTRDIAGGDVDADLEEAYFSGEEAPGGDNPTPDQDIVDDIGRAIGVEYADNEELKSADKVSERDKHRWELDPASSEDYKERK
jgi:uncharacterized protein DUF6335